jgi:hypothetical protein
MATGRIMLAFRACDRQYSHHVKRYVEWPGVPRQGETIGAYLQPEDDEQHPVESVSWEAEGDCVVFLGDIQANDDLRATAEANDAPHLLVYWKRALERSGWEVSAYPHPLPDGYPIQGRDQG